MKVLTSATFEAWKYDIMANIPTARHTDHQLKGPAHSKNENLFFLAPAQRNLFFLAPAQRN